MNLLFVNNARGRGGGEEFLRDLLPGLAAKGATIGLVCRPHSPVADMFRESAITLYPIERSGLKAFSAIFKTAKAIRQGHYDIVNIQRSHDIVQSWAAASLLAKRPMLMYTVQVAEFLKSRYLLSRMEKIVTISRHIRDQIISFSPYLAPRVSIIYYGIDLDRFNPVTIRRGMLRDRFGLSHDTPIIGTVGDLWKNQIEFLDALAIIRKEFPDARFALTASENSSSRANKFIKRASDLGLGGAVLWAGRLSKEEMLSFYADIDVAVSTHRNEGFGIWVLEALAVGTPVVSVNEGGIRDSLEGCPAGLLVDGGPGEMAAGVNRILRDPSHRARMAEAGPRWTAERFSKNRMVDDYYWFFRSMMKIRHDAAKS